MITSVHNTKIQWIRALQSQAKARREAQAFVVEGVRLAEEALASGWGAQLVIYTQDIPARGREAVRGYAEQGTPVEEVSLPVMKAACDTETPQSILAVLSIRTSKLPEHPDFILIADAVRDPGNLGTILRTSAAAGVQAVLLSPGSVDPYAPKVVRSAMGAHFRLPVLIQSWAEIRKYLHAEKKEKLQIFVAESAGGNAYTSVDLRQPLALIVGGEAEGPGQEARDLNGASVHIPMRAGVESLNAAVAAGILVFEVVRQRRGGD